MANIMNQKTKYLISKWGKRINLVEKAQGQVLSYEKRAALANALENTQDRIYATEATNPGSIGQYKRYALDIVTATVPNLIAFDVMAVQSMDNRIGMLNYIDYNYSKAKGTTEAGQTFNSSINMQKSDEYYTDDFVRDQVVVKKGAEIPAEGIKLDWYPVKVGTFSLQVGDKVAIANKFGQLESADGITGSVTPSGLLKIAGVTATDDIVVSYRYDNESVRSDGPVQAGFTNVPEIELKINSLPIEAKARTLRAYWAFDAQYELQKEYGQDIETLLATQATGELAHEIDNELTLDLLKFADAGTPLTWSRSMTQGISLVDHYDSFNAKLVEGANAIFNATRKVKANFMICGIGVASVIEIMRNFTSAGTSNVVGPHYIGTLGNIKVYVNPDYPINEFVLGYKGSNMFDAGAFYCPYMPVSSTDLIMDANFRGQRGWATMYGKKMLNSKMYLKGAITD